MSYDLKIFRNEVRLNSNSLDFLDSEENVLQFTDQQTQILKKRLKHYKYQLESKNDLVEEYNYDGGKMGISAFLTNNCLTLKCSGGSQDGLFEILQTASEFSDGDLSVLNLQEGTWENGGETFQVGEQPILNEELQDNQVPEISERKINNEVKTNNSKLWWKFW